MAFMDNMDNNDFVYILEERDFYGMCIIMVSRDYYKLETLAEKLSKQQSKYEDCDYVIVGAYLDKEYEALDEPEILYEIKSNEKKPIGNTPTLYGKEATDFLNKMAKPLTKKDKEFKKRYDAARKVSF